MEQTFGRVIFLNIKRKNGGVRGWLKLVTRDGKEELFKYKASSTDFVPEVNAFVTVVHRGREIIDVTVEEVSTTDIVPTAEQVRQQKSTVSFLLKKQTRIMMFGGGIALLSVLAVVYMLYLNLLSRIGGYIPFWYFTSNATMNLMIQLAFVIGMPLLLLIPLLGPYLFPQEKKAEP